MTMKVFRKGFCRVILMLCQFFRIDRGTSNVHQADERFNFVSQIEMNCMVYFRLSKEKED